MRRAGTGVVADRPVFSTFNLNSALMHTIRYCTVCIIESMATTVSINLVPPNVLDHVRAVECVA